MDVLDDDLLRFWKLLHDNKVYWYEKESPYLD